MNGATVCVQAGTTSEKNVADYFGANGMKYKPVVFDTAEAITSAFFAGRCQVYTTDMSDLAGARTKAPNADDYVILPQVISKEPLGPSVRRGDDEWFQIVRWTLFAMIEAEENGLTQANVDEQKASSKDPGVQRFLGVSEDTGKLLGLDAAVGLPHRQAGRQLRRELRAQPRAEDAGRRCRAASTTCGPRAA